MLWGCCSLLQIQLEETSPLLLSHHGHLGLMLIPDLSVLSDFPCSSGLGECSLKVLQHENWAVAKKLPNTTPEAQHPTASMKDSTTMFQLLLLILQGYWQENPFIYLLLRKVVANKDN